MTVLWGTAKPPTKRANPTPRSVASFPVFQWKMVSIKVFKVKCSRTEKFYTEPVKE